MSSCSSQSIFSAMDRFVKSVNNVSATVLVPSKLRDMELNSRTQASKGVPPALANTDLYSFYVMLQDVKKELLWGPGTVAAATMGSTNLGRTTFSSGRSTPKSTSTTTASLLLEQQQLLQCKRYHRPASEYSLQSLGSTASSSASSSDTDSEVDSPIVDLTDRMDRDSVDEDNSHLTTSIRHHLQGLHTMLHQLAESADYLSFRYQEEIDASTLWLVTCFLSWFIHWISQSCNNNYTVSFIKDQFCNQWTSS